MIQINHVSKRFGELEAIKDVTFSVPKGSIYGLLGSNGAGKTTLMKMIAGIYKQDRGSITVDGEPIFENIKQKERLIFLPDALYFFPHTTIRQMADFYRHIYPKWNGKRFHEMKELFPIDINQKIQRMSKGMQRQVAFWLTFSAMPDVLVLDEPLDGLDAVMRQKVKNILFQDVADREMTVIISSHNLFEVEDLCDRIGILHNGSLIIEKELDNLKTNIHKVQVAFHGQPPSTFLQHLDVVYQERRGSVLLCIIRGEEEQISAHIHKYEPILFDLLPLTLEEIFIYELGERGYAIENILV
ncbi:MULTISPECIES: ABC transporter ATP-binding protein [Anoxybacillus]|uniref:ABC transporter ATP-binding protein n=1 Tax=Anoxybacillus flavithermus TaxID=33934 RepID=A0AAX2A052_9BACL|nr:ABC transporter ATP-binding protein [Anoxybacillus flavithermus]MBE2908317.1 ABC transporter ATP-binding protein [Anoxybacillus flavithermus]MBE2911214.1 ABC transporter ATP-binding protein [Anoxybacillus flavithermus]MBE2916520.1 ABC transporter ATP-binding protein [Anoxybacillus flavithermus]MBE2918902.1 ABC transporter ATP-binding protein [Anoxybacillus flavithermus]MBE2921649.1 ABC transporter ATP-binding protein [Anoxybacillus flavithermus]